MKNQRLLYLILVSLILLVSVSAVAAADDVLGTDDGGPILEETVNEDVSIDTNDDELILDESDDVVLDSAGEKAGLKDAEISSGSFTDLDTAINGNSLSEITLTRNYTFNGTEGVDDSGFVNGIEITRAVTIDGNGYTIDGSGKARIFLVNINSGVTFKNINFINGYTYVGYGGAISVSDPNMKYTVSYSNFTNNKAEELEENTGYGGAMYKGTAINCTFSGNSASIGGAMLDGTAEYCTFSGNSASSGGAMVGGTANDCTFSGNSASSGGAIRSGAAYNCTFSGNSADFGGAMDMGTAYNCTFSGNSAGINGGAMDASTAYNCTFSGNSAGRNGGAMLAGDAYNCTFILIFDTKDKTIYGTDCDDSCTFVVPEFVVSDLITGAHSGEKLLFNLSLELDNDEITFDDINTTISISKDGAPVGTYYALIKDGWVVDLDYGVYTAQLSIENSQVEPVTATLKVTDGTSFSDLNQTINGNADTAVLLEKSYKYVPGIDDDFIHGVTISRSVVIDGNGITLDGSHIARIFQVDIGFTVKFKNINFINGNATSDNDLDSNGGAIFTLKRGYVSAESCNFTNNTAKYFGLATGVGAGGALFMVIANNCQFNENKALCGGAISCGIANNCNFTNNHADDGGAMDSGTANGCTFSGNSASSGGAMFAGDAYNCTFSGNSASIGGAICCFDACTVANSTFLQNIATHGGAIYGVRIRDGKINNNIFLNNSNTICLDGPKSYNLSNNWFGNNATNYITRPDINETIKLNDWLFLNGTADSYTIPVLGTSEVAFKLYHYDGTNVAEYDNSLLPVVNLSIVTTNGDIKSNATFNESLTYSPSNIGSATVTARIENVECSISFEISGMDVGLDVAVDPYEISYGENVTLILTYNDTANGKVNVTLTGKKHSYEFNDIDLNNTIVISDLVLPDEYEVTVLYGGDDVFANATMTAEDKLTVNYLKTKLIYENMNTGVVDLDKDGRIGDYFIVKLLDENDNPIAGLPIQIGFNGKIYERNTTSNGVIKLQINLAREEIYTFAVCFLSDDAYIGSFEVAKITVSKKNPKPNKANEDATGDPVTVTKTDDRIKTAIVAKDINVTSVLGVDGRVGDYLIVKLTDNDGNPLSGLPIQLGFNGNVYNRTTDSNGEAKLQINLLRECTYTFAIAYLGDTMYQGSFAVAKVSVKNQTPKLSSSSKTFKASAKTKSLTATLLSAKGNPIANQKVSFTVNGKTYTAKTNDKGVVTVNISLNKKGTYSCLVKFAGMEGCNAKTTKITVKIT